MWYVKISAYQHCVVDFTYMHPPPKKNKFSANFAQQPFLIVSLVVSITLLIAFTMLHQKLTPPHL